MSKSKSNKPVYKLGDERVTITETYEKLSIFVDGDLFINKPIFLKTQTLDIKADNLLDRTLITANGIEIHTKGNLVGLSHK